MSRQKPENPPQISIRQPVPDDGAAVLNLIRNSAFLDTNSLYCYLLLCTHFSATSAVAFDKNERLAGVITAYAVPQDPHTLFVWQVAVDPAARGQRLASRMLDDILSRSGTRNIRFVETTVTADNTASRALFNSFARRHQSTVSESALFEREQHFQNQHDTEYKLRIGPFSESRGEQKS